MNIPLNPFKKLRCPADEVEAGNRKSVEGDAEQRDLGAELGGLKGRKVKKRVRRLANGGNDLELTSMVVEFGEQFGVEEGDQEQGDQVAEDEQEAGEQGEQGGTHLHLIQED